MQYYPKPEEVYLPECHKKCPARCPHGTPAWPSNSLTRIIERDGLIVPILVYVSFSPTTYQPSFTAANPEQGERILACMELGFETVLVETDWAEEDLA